MSSMLALVDCNNFFVSCERLFNPKLIGKPVVVLSSNDGCIVSRSQEAKKLGIPMGAPLFQWKESIEKYNVSVLSSNFALYSDISSRVMHTLSRFHPEVEIYSVDEAFLDLNGIENPFSFCQHIRQIILQWVGIPVSIGIGPTKTLAKVASEVAKKEPGGIFALSTLEQSDALLSKLPPKEIWGIGHRMHVFLQKRGVRTALEFKNKSDLWIQKNLSVVALRIAFELRGICCFSFEEQPSPKQSIMTSRSFGSPIFDKEELKQALAHFTVKGAKKLREEKQLAHFMQIFITTSPHKEKDFYANEACVSLPQATDYTPILLEYALSALDKIYKQGFAYKKAGVLLGGLILRQGFQGDLFVSQHQTHKQREISSLVDGINEKYGARSLYFAAEGNIASRSLSSNRSEHFTTLWQDILKVKI